MFSRIISKFHIMNFDRKFNELSDSIVKTAYTLFLFSANQNEAPKIFKKIILFIIAAKKYDPVPQFLCSIAKTSKCFNRVHSMHAIVLLPPKNSMSNTVCEGIVIL